MKEIKLEGGIDVNSRSVTGQTALMFASIGSVASLVHPDFSDHNEKASPAEVSDWLLSQGANPTLIDKNGYSAIHYAAKNGLKDVVDVLINADRSLIEIEAKGWRPLHFAVVNNHYDVVDFLILNGADVNAEIDHEGTKYIAKDLVRNIVSHQDREAMSQLILAASKITAQISDDGLSLPRARSLSGEKSEGLGI